MPGKIEWIPAYSVGREDLDSQHKGLFELVDSIDDNLDSDQLNKCLMKFFKYTRQHFSAEEKLLAAIDYPQLEDHKHLHENLIAQLAVIGEAGFKDEKSLLEFKEFAFNWITDHILQEDQRYVRFVKEHHINW